MTPEDYQIVGYTLTFDPDKRRRTIVLNDQEYTARINDIGDLLTPALCVQVALYPGKDKQRSQRRSTFPAFLRESQSWQSLQSNEYLLLLVVQSYLTLIEAEQLPRTYPDAVRRTFNHIVNHSDANAALGWWALAQFCAKLK